MKAKDAKSLKEPEVENTSLKRLLAEAEIDLSMLKELAEGKWCFISCTCVTQRPRPLILWPN